MKAAGISNLTCSHRSIEDFIIIYRVGCKNLTMPVTCNDKNSITNSRSPRKQNIWLLPVRQPTPENCSQEFVNNFPIYRQVAKIPLSQNGKNSFKTFLDPNPDLDDFQTLTVISVSKDTSLEKISSFYERLLTVKQTNK